MRRESSLERPRILFIGHEAFRTGAPILLLHLLRWLRQDETFDFDLALQRGGELEADYRAVCRTFRCSPPETQSMFGQGARLALASLGIWQSVTVRRLSRRPYSLIYANCVPSCETMIRLKRRLRIPVILHVHELESVIEGSFGAQAFDRCIPHIDRYVAVSEAVRENLVTRHHVPGNRIVVVNEFLPSPPSLTGVDVRGELGLSKSSVLIGGCGGLGWRKGTDLFLQVAQRVRCLAAQLPIHFVWVGGESRAADGQLPEAWRQVVRRLNPPVWPQLDYDRVHMGLADAVTFVGLRRDVGDYMAAMDVFLCPSREDPFPLVCLEAGSLGKPVICFDKVSGCCEYIDDTCGAAIPYGDVESMARAVVKFAERADLRTAAGDVLRQRVSRYTVSKCAPRLIALMDSLL